MSKSTDSGITLYQFASTISVLCFIIFALQEFPAFLIDPDTVLTYQHSAIQDGQLWRLVTGNLLHSNIWHLTMNLAGFWIILFLHEMHYKRHGSKLVTLCFCLCVLEGIGLYFFFPKLAAYVGLSGVLHGLFTFGAMMDIRRGYRSGYLLLVGVMLKVGYEMYFGASEELASLIEIPVATESHFVGLLGGLISGGFWLSIANRFRYRQH